MACALGVPATAGVLAAQETLAQETSPQETHPQETRAQEIHAGHQLPPAGRYSRGSAAYEVPSVELSDSEGNLVQLAALLAGDHPVALQFIFTTCPSICPVMSATFGVLQQRLEGPLELLKMVSVSIDPEHDTPARLSEYAARFRAGPQWRFLTGRSQDVIEVQRAFGAYRGNKMRHEPATYLRAPGDPSWLRLDGWPTAEELEHELTSHLAQ